LTPGFLLIFFAAIAATTPAPPFAEEGVARSPTPSMR
jgi:hypothetical protein